MQLLQRAVLLQVQMSVLGWENQWKIIVYMYNGGVEASKSKCVNSILNIIGVNPLRLGVLLHIDTILEVYC